MKSAAIFAGLVGSALSFPTFNDPAALRAAMEIVSRQATQDPLGLSKAETNCGPLGPCEVFDEEDQLVSVYGDHAYRAPSADEIRGPCPGLNAAANHGYLPRSGIVSIEETVSGLQALYNLSPELAVALSAYAIATSGNIAEGVWSIGGPLPTDDLTGALLSNGQGISYDHNAYEGDASIGRNDAYTNHGDAHSLNISKFTEVYELGGPEDRYTIDKFRARFEEVQDRSIANNPYYFTAGFGPFVVVPAAYNFVINFMSNHSAEEPSGYLDGYNFKSFFGVSGEYPNLKWERGQERVPENWYRRPTSRQYSAVDTFADVGLGYLAYPNTLRFGGNVNGINTFAGIDVSNLTGGVFNLLDLTKGDNLACFSFSLLETLLPDAIKQTLNSLSQATDFINKNVGPLVNGLNCPDLSNLSTSVFSHFPGRTYSPKGPATNY